MLHARADYDRFREPDEIVQETLEAVEKAAKAAVEAYDRAEAYHRDIEGEQSQDRWLNYGRAQGARQVLNLVLAAKAEARPAHSPIAADEPVMVFRAQDALFVKLLAYYCLLLVKAGAQPEMVATVARHAGLAKVWQAIHPTKVPDAPAEVLR